MAISIPWMKPYFSGNESQYVSSAVESTWISGGEFIDKLENSLSCYTGCKHAIAVSNGTAALHLAFLAIDIKEGDEVLLPGFGFLAAANVLLHMKAIPIFVDIDPDTWCINPSLIPKSITPKTKAIVAVHPLGNLCDMDSLQSICNNHNLILLEDAAEGFPSKYKSKVAGSLADISTFSFQATKTMTTGEGGMVLTNNDQFADTVNLFKSHGLRRIKHYWHELPGLNYRLTNIQAALGCAQFEILDTIILKRRQMFESYQLFLCNSAGIVMQCFTEGVDAIVWAVGITISPTHFPQGRDAVIDELKLLGIETRPGFYTPSSLQYFPSSKLQNSESVSMNSLFLPSWPGLTQGQIQFICNSLLSLQVAS